jgi:hypothetical protein
MEASRLHLVETTPEPEPITGEEQVELPETPPADVLAESGDPLEAPAYNAAEVAEAWPEPAAAIQDVGDPLEGPAETSEDDGILTTLDRMPQLEAIDRIGVDEIAYRNAWAALGYDADRAMEFAPTLAAAFERDGVGGPEALQEFVANTKAAEERIRGQMKEKAANEERLAALESRVDEGLGRPPDPFETMIDSKLAPLVEYVQEQRSRQAAVEYADAVHSTMQTDTQSFVTDLQRRNIKVPEEADMMRAMNAAGVVESDIPWSKALQIGHSWLVANDPNYRAPQGVMYGRHPRDPRATITIPGGSTAAPRPSIYEMDPLTGDKL